MLGGEWEEREKVGSPRVTLPGKETAWLRCHCGIQGVPTGTLNGGMPNPVRANGPIPVNVCARVRACVLCALRTMYASVRLRTHFVGGSPAMRCVTKSLVKPAADTNNRLYKDRCECDEHISTYKLIAIAQAIEQNDGNFLKFRYYYDTPPTSAK